MMFRSLFGQALLLKTFKLFSMLDNFPRKVFRVMNFPPCNYSFTPKACID